jgi:hypothetical protein
MVTTFQEPTNAELEAKALRFVRQCRQKLYRELRQSGELKEYCRQKAKAARRYAENLIKSGEWEGNAWNRAIRLEILESESD